MIFYEGDEVPARGVPPLDRDLPRWDGPTPAMTRALALAQADLDVAGLDRIRLSYAVAGFVGDHPTVNVQWCGAWTGDSIDLEEDDQAAVTVGVARQLAQGLIELENTYWPTCPIHHGRAHAEISKREAVCGAAVEGRRRMS